MGERVGSTFIKLRTCSYVGIMQELRTSTGPSAEITLLKCACPSRAFVCVQGVRICIWVHPTPVWSKLCSFF